MEPSSVWVDLTHLINISDCSLVGAIFGLQAIKKLTYLSTALCKNATDAVDMK